MLKNIIEELLSHSNVIPTAVSYNLQLLAEIAMFVHGITERTLNLAVDCPAPLVKANLLLSLLSTAFLSPEQRDRACRVALDAALTVKTIRLSPVRHICPVSLFRKYLSNDHSAVI